MGVRQLQSGRWQARVTIDGRQFSATLDSEQDAQDWIVVQQARSITGTIPRRVTVRHYAERWIAHYDHAPSSTRAFHRGHLDRYILPAIGNRPASSITPSDISRLLNTVRANVSATKAQHVYRTLSVLFRSAEQDDVIERTPTRSKRHMPKVQTEPPVFLERVQAREVVMQLGSWMRDVALMQIAIGARFGEIAGLTPHDVDMKAMRVTIRRRASRNTVRAVKNHRLRTLELPRLVVPTLERLIVEACSPAPIFDLQDKEWPVTAFDRPWLIPTSTGRPANLTHYNKALKEASASAGAPHVSSHTLRHSWVSWMIDEGHSADKVAFWIGDTPETVRRVYAHMLEASSAPAAQAIDAAFGDLG